MNLAVLIPPKLRVEHEEWVFGPALVFGYHLFHINHQDEKNGKSYTRAQYTVLAVLAKVVLPDGLQAEADRVALDHADQDRNELNVRCLSMLLSRSLISFQLARGMLTCFRRSHTPILNKGFYTAAIV